MKEKISKWMNMDKSEVRLCDERSATALWQSEVSHVRLEKDNDGTPTIVLYLQNGYSLRLILKAED